MGHSLRFAAAPRDTGAFAGNKVQENVYVQAEQYRRQRAQGHPRHHDENLGFQRPEREHGEADLIQIQQASVAGSGIAQDAAEDFLD
jgi:hypothetical protein